MLVDLSNGINGSISGQSGIYVSDLQNDTLTSTNNVATLNITNDGEITGISQYGIGIASMDSDFNSGSSTNNLSIVNNAPGRITGSIDGIYDLNFDNNQSIGTGPSINNVTIQNSGVILGSGGSGIDFENIYNEANAGDATNNISIVNSGIITGLNSYGIYLPQVYNQNNAGNGLNALAITSSGTINATMLGIYIAGGNDTNAGLINSNTISVTNSGSITSSIGAGVGINFQNISNTGTNANAITMANKGTIYAPNDVGVYIDSTNSSNVGDDLQTVTFQNSGLISSGSTAVSLVLLNTGNSNPGTSSNIVNFTNTGTLVSSGGDGIDVAATNDGNTAITPKSVNSVTFSNVGTITAAGLGVGISAGNSNQASASVQTIKFYNNGNITSTASDGVVMQLTDGNTTGTQANTFTVINGPNGSMNGLFAGLVVAADTNFVSSNGASVTNYGTITGLSVFGIDLEASQSSVTTLGGTISGGIQAIALAGINDTMTIQGRTNIQGVIEGGQNSGNTLVFNLSGMTPADIANAKAAIALAGDGPGSFTAQGNTYNFDGFPTIIFNGRSFEGSVDSGLSDLATRIDNNPLPSGAGFDAVYAQGFLNPEATLNSLSGRQFLNAFQQVGLSTATAFDQLADSRAFNLRSGATGLDMSGLNITSSSMIASLGQTENMLCRLSATSQLSGVSLSDSADSKYMAQEKNNTPRWGAWVSGAVTLGDQSSANQLGYNSTAGSPTIGLDYLLCPNLVVGTLFSYTTTGVDFNDGSNLNENTYLGGLYADWSHGPWYINALAAGGYNSYDQSRNTLAGVAAQGSTSGSEAIASLAGGRDFRAGGWTFSPEIGLQYTYLEKDAFGESGGGGLNLNVGEQDVNSLRTKAGLNIQTSFNALGCKFTPQLNAFWYHECLDDTAGVSNSLPGAPAVGSFTVNTNQQGRNFAVAGAGISATPTGLDNGNVSFFVNYGAQVGQDNFMSNTVAGGVRVQF